MQTYDYKGRQAIILDPGAALLPGDRIMIRFEWLTQGTYSRAGQWAAIESNLDNRPDFEVISYVNSDLFLDAEILVKQANIAPGAPIAPSDPFENPWAYGGGMLQPASLVVNTGVAITAAAIAAVVVSVTVYLSRRSYYKFVKQEPVTAMAAKAVEQVGGMGVAVIVVAVAVLLVLKFGK